MGMSIRRRTFLKLTPRIGKKVEANILAVGTQHLLATCGGFDMTLSQRDLDCMCLYSLYQNDEDFDIGDQVIVVITKYDYARKLVYGKIVAKW